MAVTVIDINCPKCGAPVDTSQKICKFCKSPVIISTFNSVNEMPMPMLNQYANAYQKALSGSPENKELNSSIAMCYLKLKLYDKALAAFEKAIEGNFDNSETFFYAAVCLLRGQKAFVAQRPAIDKIVEYINAALQIEPKGIYYYFLAYIKLDYFNRKFLNISPTYQETLEMANGAGVSPHDIEQLYGILGVPRPEAL